MLNSSRLLALENKASSNERFVKTLLFSFSLSLSVIISPFFILIFYIFKGRSNEKGVERENTRSQAVLVFSEKQSFRKLGDIIYQLNQSGEIYVRRDALTILFGNRIMYGNILTYGGEPL